jgi:hypothetical protein
MERLRLSPECHQLLATKAGEVLRECGLAEVQPFAERSHRQFSLGDEVAQDQQPLFVAERAQKIRCVSGSRPETQERYIHEI